MDCKKRERSVDLFLETIDDTCPLVLKKTQTVVACEKQKHRHVKYKYFTWIQDVLQELLCLSSIQTKKSRKHRQEKTIWF